MVENSVALWVLKKEFLKADRSDEKLVVLKAASRVVQLVELKAAK